MHFLTLICSNAKFAYVYGFMAYSATSHQGAIYSVLAFGELSCRPFFYQVNGETKVATPGLKTR